MAVSFRAIGTATNSSFAVNPSVAYPTNAVGDVILLFCIAPTSTTITTPSGFTLVATYAGGTSTDPSINLFWRSVTTVLSGSVSITQSTNGSFNAVMLSYSGADTTAPPSVKGGSLSTTASAAVLGPSLASAPQFIVMAVAQQTGVATNTPKSNTSGQTWTATSRQINSTTNSGFSFFEADGSLSPGNATFQPAATAAAASTYTTYAVGLAAAGTGSSGDIKVYTGAAFAAKPIKYWNGTAWVIKPLKYWNGTSWTPTKY